MRGLAAILLGLALLGASGAEAYNARNGLRVSGPPSDIEVFGSSAGSKVFCAAGDYARRKLSAPSNYRVVIVRPYGPSPNHANQRSVGLILTGPEGQTDWWGGGVLPWTGKRGVGMSRSVGHAGFLCESGSNRR